MSVLTEPFVFFQLYQVSSDILLFSRFSRCCCCCWERDRFDSLSVPLYGSRAVGNSSRPFVPMMVYLSTAKQKNGKPKQRARSNLYDLVFWWYHYLTLSYCFFCFFVFFYSECSNCRPAWTTLRTDSFLPKRLAPSGSIRPNWVLSKSSSRWINWRYGVNLAISSHDNSLKSTPTLVPFNIIRDSDR